MREKVAPEYFFREVHYDKNHREIFSNKRKEAFQLLKALEKFNPLLHGSLARGDVHSSSDIDIIILSPINEFQLVRIFDQLEYRPIERWLVQATPLSAIKANITLDVDKNITFPLIPFYPRENDFYLFGGAVQLADLVNDLLIRVPGVDKKLLFIQPIDEGHIEYRVTPENAKTVAKILNISIETIFERIRVLERRNEVGRTGMFIKRLLKPTESFGQVLNELERTSPASRRRIRRKKI